jgi:hypothetical protein
VNEPAKIRRREFARVHVASLCHPNITGMTSGIN